MASVERLLRIRYYVGGRQVKAGTPGAVRVEDRSKCFYAVFRGGKGNKRKRIKLDGITTRAKAEEKLRQLLAEVQENTRLSNVRTENSLDTLLSLYEERLNDKGLARQTVKDEISKLTVLLKNLLEITVLDDIKIPVIQNKIQNGKTSQPGKKPKPWSARTKNFYIGALVRFGKWLKSERYWKRNLFLRLEKFRGAKVKERRYMTLDELNAIIESARNSGNSGKERALFYQFLFYTLTRAEASRNVILSQLSLDKDPAVLMLRGDQVKNKKSVVKTLHPVLVVELKTWVVEKQLKEKDRVFPGITKWVVSHFNKDLKRAGIQKVLADGSSVDIHSFKTTAISMLHDSGVPLKVIQELAEHANPQTTMNHYVRSNQSTLAQAFLHLPKIG